MADLNFNTNISKTIDLNSSSDNNNLHNNHSTSESHATTDSDIPTPANTRGMSAEELNDANKITINIADKQTPLIILFGSPSSGKTMTLVRLTRFLRTQGYSVTPVTSFRPAYDDNYKQMCDSFDFMINNEEAANANARINFMLLKVSKNGNPICQILEGPGEHYFHPEKPTAPFPRYINAIINSNSRKIWTIMVEPDNTNPRMDLTARTFYANKIQKLKSSLNPRDKVVFLYNKIDATDFIISPGVVKEKLAMKDVSDMYPGIFTPFLNQIPIIKSFRPYNFDFVSFHTGDYTKAADTTLMFTAGHDNYPRNLWRILLKRIHG